MKTKIVGVLGLGIFGRTIVRELSLFGYDVIAIDSKEENIQDVAELVHKSAIGDITDLDLLKNIGIAQCDLVVIATGNNLESSVLAVMNCKKLGIQQIIAKAKSETFEEVLYGIGASKVISPERETGMELASLIMRYSITDIYHLEDNIAVIEFVIPQDWVGKTILALDIRNKFDLNIIGTRAEPNQPLTTAFPLDAPLQSKTIIVAVANNRTFEKYDYLGYFR